MVDAFRNLLAEQGGSQLPVWEVIELVSAARGSVGMESRSRRVGQRDGQLQRPTLPAAHNGNRLPAIGFRR